MEHTEKVERWNSGQRSDLDPSSPPLSMAMLGKVEFSQRRHPSRLGKTKQGDKARGGQNPGRGKVRSWVSQNRELRPCKITVYCTKLLVSINRANCPRRKGSMTMVFSVCPNGLPACKFLSICIHKPCKVIGVSKEGVWWDIETIVEGELTCGWAAAGHYPMHRSQLVTLVIDLFDFWILFPCSWSDVQALLRTKQTSGQIGDRIFLTQLQTRGNGLFRRSVKFLKFHSYRQFLLREEGAQDYKRTENSY
jgi:hypothetical protein